MLVLDLLGFCAGSGMSSSAPARQRNGRHRSPTAHYDRDTHDLEVLIPGANEELFTDLTVDERKVPYFRAAGQA